MQHLHQADIVLDHRRVLRAEEDRRAAAGLRQRHVIRREALEDQVGKALEPAVPRHDVRDRFTEGLMIGDGDMQRIDAALAQLAEDSFRPIVILQPIDQGWSRHAGSPAAT